MKKSIFLIVFMLVSVMSFQTYPGNVVEAKIAPASSDIVSAVSFNLANTAWPMVNHDARHTGQSPNLGSPDNTFKWTYFVGSSNFMESSPAISSDGTIYFGANNQLFYAVKPDGSLKWIYNQAAGGGRLRSSPALGSDGTIYVGGANDNYLHAITDNGTTGDMKWKLGGIHVNRSSPVIGEDGTIYIGDNNPGGLYAVSDNGAYGSVKWYFDTGTIDSNPAIGSDGTIYVINTAGILFAITDDGSSGILKWALPLAGYSSDQSPSIGADGVIYIVAGNTLHAVIDADFVGFSRWEFTIPGALQLSSPSIASDGTIYVGSNNSLMVAIKDLGLAPELKWIYPTGGNPVYAAPSIGSDGTLYFGAGTDICAVVDNGVNGIPRWSYFTGSSIYTSPAIARDGTIYMTVGIENVPDGRLMAINGFSPEMKVDGNGIEIVSGDITPTEADHTDFGSAAVSGGTIDRTFTIYNTGHVDLNLSDTPKVSLSGPAASNFSITSQPDSPIAPGDNETFTVRFDPSSLGLRAAVIGIYNDDLDESFYYFLIQGTGTLFPEMRVEGNGTEIIDGDTTPSEADHTDFGSAAVSGGTIDRTFTIYNTGDADLTLSDSPKVSLSGTNASDFSVISQPDSPIAPGYNKTFIVKFDPSAPGLRTAALSIANDDSDENPYNFDIKGTGADITVTPTSGLVTTEWGGTATFTIVLDSQPAADVIIGLTSSDTTEGTVSPSIVPFTAANWDLPQTVTVTGANDFVVDGDIVYTVLTAAAASADGGYNNLNASDVEITNYDNDVETFTHSGIASFSPDKGNLENLVAVAEGNSPGKPDYKYPHGFFSFDITGLKPGATVVITITLPTNAPTGTKWVKYQNSTWTILPIGDDDGDNIITITLTDEDRDGTISDPGAPGYPRQYPIGVGGEIEPVNKANVIFPWLALVSLISAGGVILVLRRRKAS
jgi:outer membrane protein assembly factor BamB